MKTNALSPGRTGRRAGFTLVELLVVISIMAVLVGLGVAATMKFRETATNDAAKNQVKRLQLALNREYDAVLAKCQKEPIPDAILSYCENDRDRARAVHTAATLRANFPDTFTEATNGFSINGYLYEPKVTFKPVRNFTGGTPEEQSAVLLHLIIKERSTTGGDGEDGGSTGEVKALSLTVGSVTKDFNIFVDPRGKPVSYSRWARNAELDSAPYAHPSPAPASSKDPLDPKRLVAAWPGTTGTANRNYLNNTGATFPGLGFDDAATNRNRVPSVVSWGVNKTFDNFTGDDIKGYQFNRQGN